jgi:CTP:molybdopterin cytidylyltransferase MocA
LRSPPRRARRATPLIRSSLIDRLIEAFDAALLGDTLFPAVRMLQGNKGARDFIAAARDNILELTAGDLAMEIDIDTREDPSLHGI